MVFIQKDESKENEKKTSKTSKLNDEKEKVEADLNLIDTAEKSIGETELPVPEIENNVSKIIENKVFSPPNTAKDSKDSSGISVAVEESSQAPKEHKPTKTNNSSASKEQVDNVSFSFVSDGFYYQLAIKIHSVENIFYNLHFFSKHFFLHNH